MTFYIVLLAMVAGFLAMRLFNVLGKRTGHEQQPLPRAADDRALPVTTVRKSDAAAEQREPFNRNIDAKAEAGLRQIVSAEPAFDMARFLEGAQGAYRMVLEAFWKGDEATLADLCAPDVKAAFSQAIAAREAAGHTLDNRLVSVERASVVDTVVEGREARISVRFDADIAAVTRDAEGHVVAGSLTDAVETHDVWTFTRTLRSSDPNWKLADTDEA